MATNQTIVSLSASIAELTTRIGLLEDATNTTWVATCTYLVFLMQTGFTLLEAGTARHKSYLASMIKNIIDLVCSTIGWWLVGYGVALGKDHSSFIGTTGFAANKNDLTTFEDFNSWMFQWAFAGTAATIVSGCILERMSVFGYGLYSFYMITWIYPLVGKI